MRSKIVWGILIAAPGLAMEAALSPIFIPNAGQTNAEILYVVQTPDLRAGFAADGAYFQIGGTRLGVRFAGARAEATIHGSEVLSGQANFLIGSDPRHWKTGLTAYGKIVYRDLYPGIDATYEGTDRRLKSEFLVDPGADPSLIRMDYGEARVRIDVNGDLVVSADGMELREAAPEVYQTFPAGKRVNIAARYRRFDDGTVGFSVGPYDASLPLIIDPVITYSTYLGGSGMGAVTGLARDTSGSLYITGWTEALNFPIAGAHQAANGGGVDAFVVKLNPAGTGIAYATYIGGSGDDRSAAIAVDSSGQALVAGATGSPNFPLVAAIRSTLAGGKEGFALKLTQNGSGLLYSTFLGGANHDAATAVAVDASGSAYIAGDTLSTDFPRLNATQNLHGGGTDAFLVKLSSQGVMQFGTLLGGSRDEHAGGIVADASGNATMAGGTDSPDFPVFNAIQGAVGGGQDGFVTRIRTATPPAVLFSTFLGGNSGSPTAPEQINGIASDASGNLYVAGVTSSTNFPLSTGALQSSFAGSRDAFVTKFSPDGSARLYSTYLGTPGFDWASAIGVDAQGSAAVAGYTSFAGFPTVAGLQSMFGGLYDAFVIKLNPGGNGIVFSTFYGGSGADQAAAIAVDGAGNIFVGGQTSSVDLPVLNALQTSNAGSSTGWVARLGESPPPSQPPSTGMASLVIGTGGAATVTATFSHPGGAGSLTSASVLIGNSTALDFACHVVYDPGASVFRLSNDVASSGSVVVPPGSGAATNNQCTLRGSGSSAVFSGATLTLTLNLTLLGGFPAGGANVLYVSASAGAITTGWVAKGGLPKPSVDTVSPSSGSGAGQTFTFVFSDSQNALNLTGMAMLFNSSQGFANACYIVYDRLAGSIALLYDNANGSIRKPPGSAQVLQNTQCAVGLVTVIISGQSILITAAITFKPGFNGVQKIYMSAAEVGQNTGWFQKGAYTVATGGTPMVNGVTPSASGGTGAVFEFSVSDPAGSNYITGIAVLFSASLDTNNACYLNYDRAANRVSVSYDTAAAGSSPVELASSTVISNSQCTLRGLGSSVSFGAATVTLRLNLSFHPTFAGPKNIYLAAAEPGVNTGLQHVGAWTVTAATPTADSVNPSSGSGFGETFVATVTDPVSNANVTGISLLFTAAGPSNACWIFYDGAQNRIGLYSDDLSTLNSKPLGSSASLQNSQCAIGYSVRFNSGNAVILNAFVQFKSPAFSGIKTIYLQAHTAGSSSGWATRGAWSVP